MHLRLLSAMGHAPWHTDRYESCKVDHDRSKIDDGPLTTCRNEVATHLSADFEQEVLVSNPHHLPAKATIFSMVSKCRGYHFSVQCSETPSWVCLRVRTMQWKKKSQFRMGRPDENDSVTKSDARSCGGRHNRK